jgi:putative hemolysin
MTELIFSLLFFCAQFLLVFFKDRLKIKEPVLCALVLFCACAFAITLYAALVSFGADALFYTLVLCAAAALLDFLILSRSEEKKKSLQAKEIRLEPAKENEPEVLASAEVMENALELKETALEEICTHRSDVVSLSLKDSPSKWRQIILANRHTFYPISNEDGDDIVGVLDTRDYFRLAGLSKSAILDQTVDKPFFVSENMTADELLHRMKLRKTYFAIVLDEYGGVTGIVTLHDIIEELLGDMPDAEQDKKPADIVKLPKGVYRINGEAHLDDVSRVLGVTLELDEFETFSGYILGTIGYIPEDGTQFEVTIGPLHIQIKKVQNHRIRQTLVRLEAPKQTGTEEKKPEEKNGK